MTAAAAGQKVGRLAGAACRDRAGGLGGGLADLALRVGVERLEAGAELLARNDDLVDLDLEGCLGAPEVLLRRRVGDLVQLLEHVALTARAVVVGRDRGVRARTEKIAEQAGRGIAPATLPFASASWHASRSGGVPAAAAFRHAELSFPCRAATVATALPIAFTQICSSFVRPRRRSAS